jgi:pectin methylesterase-like acyl-CoA thioesterase
MLSTIHLSRVVIRFAFVASLLLGALPAGAATLTVGAAGSGCNHTTIQAAVNAAQAAAGSDTIRISRSAAWTAQAISINTDDEVTLVGGYAECGSATPQGPKTLISGSGGAAAGCCAASGSAADRIAKPSRKCFMRLII